MTATSGPFSTAIPLTILTGFLGAGKTTLLNRLLAADALRDSLVLVNEIGEIGLDHLLMERIDGDVIALAGGCLCCSVRSDLIDSLEDLALRRDAGEIPPFNRVILETSGLADPLPVLQAAQIHPYLSVRYALDGVIAVADALTGASALDRHEEAVRQIAVADRIVLTKTDLVAGDAAIAAEARLRAKIAELAPSAEVLDAARGEAVPEKLFDIAPWSPHTKIAAVRDWLAAGENVSGAHESGIRTTTLWSDAALPPTAFSMFIDLLRSVHGEKILRLKGLVRTTIDPERPVVIHGVQHVFHAPRRLDAWPDEDRRTRIVVIGRDLDASLIARLYDAFAGVPALDAPTRDVLVENPLAPPGLRAG